jgi:hypothetical protein
MSAAAFVVARYVVRSTQTVVVERRGLYVVRGTTTAARAAPGVELMPIGLGAAILGISALVIFVAVPDMRRA